MASLGTQLSSPAVAPPLAPASFPAAGLSFTSRAFSRRQWLFVVADLSAISSAAFLAIALSFPAATAIPGVTIGQHLAVTILYAVVIMLFAHTQDLYSPYQQPSRSRELLAIAKSVLFATSLLGSVFLLGVKSISGLVIGVTAFSAVVGMFAWRDFRRRSLGRAHADGLSCHNVLIVGTTPDALALGEHLTRNRQLGFVVVGHVDVPGSHAAHNILGTVDHLKSLCRTHFIDELIVCTHDRRTVMQIIADARESNVGVRVIPDLYDGMAFGAHFDHLGHFPSIAVVHRSVPAVSMKLKRTLDVVVSGLGLVFLSPLLLLLAILIKLDSKGSVFYSSARVGRKGRVFRCHKLRTMVLDADCQKANLRHLNERDGVLFKIAKDPRTTRIGRILRKYSFDEIPQLWNVLRGDMSLVGPRPPLVAEVKQYQLDYLRRLEVAPGITGLWQVEARANPSFQQYISLDLNYVENWKFTLDLQILLRTIAVVVAGTGT